MCSPTVFTLLLLAAEPAADWPMFRGNPDRTGVAQTPENMARSPHLSWTFESGEGPLESSAAIVGGTAYLGTGSGDVIALDLDTGKLRGKRVLSSKAGFRSSPTVAGGRIYLGDESGVFHVFSSLLKEELWSFEAEGEIVSSATLSGERVLFGSYDGRLYCLQQDSGKLLWKFEIEQPVHATPTLADGAVLIAGCDGFLRAVDVASGKEISSTDMGGYTGATPAVVSGRVYVGTFNNQVLCVDWKKGEVVWRYEHPKRQFPFYASPAVLGDLVIVAGRDKIVHGLHRKSGKSLWTFTARGRMDSSPVICGDTIFVGSQDGTLYGLEFKTGQQRWSFTAGSAILASPAISNGRLVIGADDGRIYCFDLRGKMDSEAPPTQPAPQEKTPGSPGESSKKE